MSQHFLDLGQINGIVQTGLGQDLNIFDQSRVIRIFCPA